MSVTKSGEQNDQNRHQHISSPTSVTIIGVTLCNFFIFSVYEEANFALECDWPSGSEPFKPQWFKVRNFGEFDFSLSNASFSLSQNSNDG